MGTTGIRKGKPTQFIGGPLDGQEVLMDKKYKSYLGNTIHEGLKRKLQTRGMGYYSFEAGEGYKWVATPVSYYQQS